MMENCEKTFKEKATNYGDAIAHLIIALGALKDGEINIVIS